MLAPNTTSFILAHLLHRRDNNIIAAALSHKVNKELRRPFKGQFWFELTSGANVSIAKRDKIDSALD
jgi:hypothetical protein